MEKVNFSQLLTCLQYYSFKRNFSFTWLILYSFLNRRHGVRFSSGTRRLQQGLSLAGYLCRSQFYSMSCCFWASTLSLLSSSLCPYRSTDSLNISQTHVCLEGVGHNLAFPSISSSSSCHNPQPASAASVLPAKEYVHCTKVSFRLNLSWRWSVELHCLQIMGVWKDDQRN